ncbi:RHS repeat-associated core domain-containing protein [Paucidesulfovibrio gracilis DSM 16080]|uniref:RHS repeat-associated core domain-containing protein n=1 Tax=Paucidesulfovibrio gracilis DSM 16080 TaxID=1121449 RepID=A0A1T4Y8G9_9BACT|nr:RHS repeat-associated core domain-containing protein [Paucidesulfovibrio gracilis]SKA97990.1 RHS repeat-associated core domain-containing protein [Paucidesulfovibrio gracilis DSM 16080]
MNGKYTLHLEHGRQGRVRVKNETVNSCSVRWEYCYDAAGRLAEVRRDGSGVERYIYDSNGRRAEDYVPLRGQRDRVFRYGADNRLLQAGEAQYAHDSRGFRSRRVTLHGETRYHYAPDYRLLAVELSDGRVVEYSHDRQGLRTGKYVDGMPVERFRWHDRAHLAAWSHVDMADGQWLDVIYDRTARPLGLASQRRGQPFVMYFYTDQVGSVRVVELSTEGMVKEILYDAFGNVLHDGNPCLCSPFGFAGGLHDPDTGLVRFGWRDYDPDTGRFTAQDPMGAAGGDPDWYGYCLDDPVNGVDPWGLEGEFWGGMKRIGAGLGELWDKAPAGIGEAVTKGRKGAGEALSKTADAFTTNSDLQKYTAIALGAGALPIAAAVGTTATPAMAAAAMQHPDKLAAASKAAADFASGAFDPGPPPASWSGYLSGAANYTYDQYKKEKRSENQATGNCLKRGADCCKYCESHFRRRLL